MAIFLDWFASHNTLVIQLLAAIVALLIIFLIFRLFFVTHPETEKVQNVTYAQLEEKLNKLLEQQSQMKTSVSAITDATPAGEVLGEEALAALSGDPAVVAAARAASADSANQSAELSRLRAEISTLKDSVKRKEVEIVDAKDQAQKSINTDDADSKLNALNAKVKEYENEIDNLKNRLSDYEIIAEDIADLQAFKKENAELKNQLAQKGLSAAEASKVETTEALIEESVKEIETQAPSPSPETLSEEIVVSTDSDSILDEESFPEPEVYATKPLDNAEVREVSKGVSEEDKILLDEFEKHFAKDED